MPQSPSNSRISRKFNMMMKESNVSVTNTNSKSDQQQLQHNTNSTTRVVQCNNDIDDDSDRESDEAISVTDNSDNDDLSAQEKRLLDHGPSSTRIRNNGNHNDCDSSSDDEDENDIKLGEGSHHADDELHGLEEQDDTQAPMQSQVYDPQRFQLESNLNSQMGPMSGKGPGMEPISSGLGMLSGIQDVLDGNVIEAYDNRQMKGTKGGLKGPTKGPGAVIKGTTADQTNMTPEQLQQQQQDLLMKQQKFREEKAKAAQQLKGTAEGIRQAKERLEDQKEFVAKAAETVIAVDQNNKDKEQVLKEQQELIKKRGENLDQFSKKQKMQHLQQKNKIDRAKKIEEMQKLHIIEKQRRQRLLAIKKRDLELKKQQQYRFNIVFYSLIFVSTWITTYSITLLYYSYNSKSPLELCFPVYQSCGHLVGHACLTPACEHAVDQFTEDETRYTDKFVGKYQLLDHDGNKAQKVMEKVNKYGKPDRKGTDQLLMLKDSVVIDACERLFGVGQEGGPNRGEPPSWVYPLGGMKGEIKQVMNKSTGVMEDKCMKWDEKRKEDVFIGSPEPYKVPVYEVYDKKTGEVMGRPFKFWYERWAEGMGMSGIMRTFVWGETPQRDVAREGLGQ